MKVLAVVVLCFSVAFAVNCPAGFVKQKLEMGNNFFTPTFWSNGWSTDDPWRVVNVDTCTVEFDGNACLIVTPAAPCCLLNMCIKTKGAISVTFSWISWIPGIPQTVATQCDKCTETCYKLNPMVCDVTSFKYCFDGPYCNMDAVKAGGATATMCCPIKP